MNSLLQSLAPSLLSGEPELRAGKSLDPEAFELVRRHALLEGCKWDPQVGDVSTLAPFPLVMKRNVWARIAAFAEQLATEAELAEEQLLQLPAGLARLGLPRALKKVLAASSIPTTPAPCRVMRFDFHPTTDGWRISEANSDVPGGFSEASCFTELMAEHFPDLTTSGNPANTWCDELARAAGPNGVVALLSAPGFMEDHQVIVFLAAGLRRRGCRPYLAKPRQIDWNRGFAALATSWFRGPVDLIVRFYQSEWLARMPAKYGWQQFFRGGHTPVINPMRAVLSESKRFPLVWDVLSTPLKTWRALLPETREPREVGWANDDRWLVKTAMCNNGDSVRMPELLNRLDRIWTQFEVLTSPGKWAAQRRFEPVPISTPAGLRHVCIGIYTINGQAAGAYARISPKPLIDFAATDAALLLESDD